MRLTDDTSRMLQAAVALANSALGTGTLTTVEDLALWYAEHLRSPHRTIGEREPESVRAVRRMLYELLAAERDRAAEIVNELLAELSARSGAAPR